MAVRIVERLTLTDGCSMEIQRAADDAPRFALTRYGVVLMTDGDTGKSRSDTELWPWHRVKGYVERRVRQ